jgi:hypothetical protein
MRSCRYPISASQEQLLVLTIVCTRANIDAPSSTERQHARFPAEKLSEHEERCLEAIKIHTLSTGRWGYPLLVMTSPLMGGPHQWQRLPVTQDLRFISTDQWFPDQLPGCPYWDRLVRSWLPRLRSRTRSRSARPDRRFPAEVRVGRVGRLTTQLNTPPFPPALPAASDPPPWISPEQPDACDHERFRHWRTA